MWQSIFRVERKIEKRQLRRLLGLMVVATLLLTSCANYGQSRVRRGFYYWKSNFSLSRTDRENLTRLRVQDLYVKFFDVTWEGQPVPVSTVSFTTRPPQRIRIVPTVFITNDTLKKLPASGVADLARKIGGKIRRIGEVNHLGAFTELQFDCDWTDGTRQKYFALLQKLKKEWVGGKVRISATIRLHQIKYYERTGIPPVDRGVLMFYNMGELARFATKNSILDLDLARQYTDNLSRYPLELDLALPLFSWGVVFQDQRYIGLAGNFHLSDLQRQPFKRERNNLFQVQANVFLHDTQLYKGDTVRLEESTFEECRKSAAFLKPMLKLGPQNRVLFFHFDAANIGVMGIDQVEQVYRTFN